jgi:cellulose/xylan binding protein with CBM9 domain
MKKNFSFLLVCLVPLCAGVVSGQADFPAGIEGEVYYAPRIDLVPASEGGPYTITLDGTLNEPAWERAAFHGYSNVADDPRNLDPVDDDNNIIWAAVADDEFLYVAWKIVDDSRVFGESTLCNVWQDDAVEVYIDALNNGPDCTADTVSCYAADDAQLTVGVDQLDKAPEDLEVGGVAGQGACDFTGPVPEVIKGVVSELVQGDIDNPFGEEGLGWQAEIAIALDTLGNADDGTPTYQIDSSHGKCIGWNVQTNDDDEDPTPGSDRDHKLIWSKVETAESSWRNPGVFGKLQFVDPTRPLPTLCPDPVRQVTCERNPDNTVTVAWVNPASVDPNVMTDILVDGTSKKKVPGDASTAMLTEADVPVDNMDHVISVVNNSGTGVPCTLIGQPLDPDCGAIRFWNILGPYENEGGANPGVDFMRMDFLTDGTTSETDFVFEPGATIQSTAPLDGNPSPRNPGMVPTVFGYQDADARVSFPDAFKVALSTSVAYAQVYLNFEAETEAFLGITSDDAVQVLLNGEEVHINDVARGGASPCDFQDAPGPVIFQEGQNSLLVKVFQGIGGWEFSVRLQDSADFGLAVPITEGYTISLTPSGPPPGPRFVRGDANADGSINITDGVFVLNFLFLGGPEPRCVDAAEATDDGQLNITDGVFILNWLFISGAAPPPPSPATANYLPSDCGEDPTADDVTCAEFPPCA